MITQEPRAKSRISSAPRADHVAPSVDYSHSTPTRRRRSVTYSFSKVVKDVTCLLPNVFQADQTKNQYVENLPFLGTSLLLFGILAYVLATVRPSAISNIILFHSYIPILALVFFGCFFLGKFLFSNTASAVGPSLWLTVLLLLRFQDFTLTPILVVSSGLVLIGLSYIWTVLFRP